MASPSLTPSSALLFVWITIYPSLDEAADENLPQFKVFCSIYSLIKEPEKQVNLLDKEVRAKVEQFVREIERLVVVTSLPADVLELKKQLDAGNLNWSLEEMDGGHGKLIRRYEYLVPQQPSVKLANKRIKRVLEAASKIQAKFNEEDKKLKGLEDNIRKELKKALAGNEDGTIGPASFRGSPSSNVRKDSCSHDATGPGPGKSIVNDVFCLCGEKYTDNGSPQASNACGNKVGAHANWGAKSGADDKLPSTPGPSFSKIMETCPEKPKDEALEGSDLMRAVQDFDALLGKAIGHTTYAAWHPYHFGLGDATADGQCAGADNDHHEVCVNYKKALEKSGPGIEWRTALLQAAKGLGSAANLAEKLKQMEPQLGHLALRAWDVYETARDEVQQKQIAESNGPTTPASNTSASKEPNAKNSISAESHSINAAKVKSCQLARNLLFKAAVLL